MESLRRVSPRDRLLEQEAEDLTVEALSFDIDTPPRQYVWRKSHFRYLESERFTLKRGHIIHVKGCRVKVTV